MMRETCIFGREAAQMNDGSSVIEKEAVEKEDGRYLILYTFDSDEVEEIEEIEDTGSEGRETRCPQR